MIVATLCGFYSPTMFRLWIAFLTLTCAFAQSPAPVVHSWAGKEVGKSLESDSLREKAAEDEVKKWIATLKDADAAVVFEGLPHQGWQEALVNDEIARKKTIRLFGYAFYEQPTELSRAQKKEFQEILASGPWFGALEKGITKNKMCGGFHPDYQIEWKTKGSVVQIQFCLGCRDVRIYTEKEKIFGDLKGNERLTKWLRGFRKLRPADRQIWDMDAESSKQKVIQLKALLKKFTKAELTIWEGLPSRIDEDAVLQSERNAKKPTDIHGYDYYEPAQPMTDQQRNRLLQIVDTRGALTAASHPDGGRGPQGDFLIRWKTSDDELDAQVDFEREEIHYYWRDDYGFVGLSKEALSELKKALLEFRKQRPPVQKPVETK